MMPAPPEPATATPDANRLAELALSLALGAPEVFGGGVVRGFPSEGRERILRAVGPCRRLPLGADATRLMGGLDLAATLAAGRPVAAPGLLAEGDAPILLSSAERASPEVAALLAAALGGELKGIAPRPVFALDEALPDEPGLSERLADRLAFVIDSQSVTRELSPEALPAHWRAVTLPDDLAGELAHTALAFGVPSLRSALHACQAAKALAALAGRKTVAPEEAALAAILAIIPRARAIPEPEAPDPPTDSAEAPPENDAASDDPGEAGEVGEMPDRLVDAILARLGENTLASLAGEAPRRAASGRAGKNVKGRRGRPVGVRAGLPGRNGRLALVETLTAALPWSRLRGAEPGRVSVRKGDLRVRRTKAKAATLTIFCVDASGSQAMARMAEAKGAVETLLAEAYVRRDEVALVAFRKTGAEILLPPTGSLTRAKRALAALPAGGGTPLAAGLAASLTLAKRAMAEGRQPSLVVLTDARANINLSGQSDRQTARAEADRLAAQIKGDRIAAAVIDTAARPAETARALAKTMAARYVPLAAADAATIAGVAKASAA